MGERTANDKLIDLITPPIPSTPAKRPAPDASVMEPTSGARMSPHPKTLDLGEHVIGSSHRHMLDPIVNLDPNGRDMTVLVQVIGDAMHDVGDGEFQVVHALGGGLAKDGLALPVGLTFAPTRVGAFTGNVTIRAVWPDRLAEEHTVQITARARKLEDTPEKVRQAEAGERIEDRKLHQRAVEGRRLETALETENAKHEEPYKQNAKDELDRHLGKAGDHITSLSNHQRTAINKVEREAMTFVAVAEDESSVWRVLAKLALQIGVSGVAAVVGGALGAALAGYAVHLLEGAHETVHMVTEGMSAVVEDGIKLGVDAAYEHGAGEAAGKVTSSDPKRYAAAFFTAQSESVDSLFDQNMAQLRQRYAALLPLLRTVPEAPGQLMAMLASAFEAAVKRIPDLQTHATRTKWTDYVAQTNLGTEHGGTNTEKAHEHKTHGLVPNAEPMNGMVDVFVDGAGDDMKVRRARVFGVARPVAQELLFTDLNSGSFPIRILIENGGGVITRDEHGVVRASGWYRLFDQSGGGEAQLIDGAEAIVAKVCRQTLSAWGVSAIETNDA